MEQKDSTASITDFKGSLSGINIADMKRKELQKLSKSTSTTDSSWNISGKKFNIREFKGIIQNPDERNDAEERNTKGSQTSFLEEEEPHSGGKF